MANNFVKSFFKVTSISIITRLVSFVFHIYLTRIFGALNIGIYSIASSVFVMFACFASSGFPVTLSRKIAHYDAIGDYNHSNSLLTATLIITAGISTAICLFFNLFPSSMNLLFSNPKCREVFRILSPTLISTAIYATFRAWFWGKKKYTTYSLLEFADEAFLLIGVLIIWLTKIYASEPYNAFALANVIGDIFCMIIIVVMFIVFGGKIKRPLYADEITKSSLPITTTRIIGSLMSSVVALLLPSLLVNGGMTIDMATADYGRMSSMVLPIALAPNTIIGSLLVIMIPEIASEVAKQGKSSANGKISYSMIFTAITSAFLMAIFISCGEDISVMFYNDLKAGKMLVITAMIIIPLV
ncbi:MAG: oligosaccharide flippase family protein, partial [Clostridia bacterium]|nr:oligosaccharide flippase family protein [Clostridia bacterium]